MVVDTFWEGGGYETTSIGDLTKALGITAPSLYSTFGDKMHIFLEAVRLYTGATEELKRNIADGARSPPVTGSDLAMRRNWY
ncbi:TetR family transcriptional regulator [Granulicella sp. 5B5]|uniref:TetR/AcrR family transcriptional regulator n=1 Tax=Granulicella sp. 5B5 TaxID=1617967 RepID=UPI0015F5D34C|nr:TetR/AcrR family transcriptional regulator [Granulicella sp. 5B5]QMV17965.1 TetR family transcriptional regulator [Granulicella sp. 5B5]